MESLGATFKQRVSEMNQDKKYYLQKLKDDNEAAEEVSDYLEYLVEKSEQLSSQEKGKTEEKDPVISEQSTEVQLLRKP